jgi:hypothetical protein
VLLFGYTPQLAAAGNQMNKLFLAETNEDSKGGYSFGRPALRDEIPL